METFFCIKITGMVLYTICVEFLFCIFLTAIFIRQGDQDADQIYVTHYFLTFFEVSNFGFNNFREARYWSPNWYNNENTKNEN